jgi:hypothetical protein
LGDLVNIEEVMIEGIYISDPGQDCEKAVVAGYG